MILPQKFSDLAPKILNSAPNFGFIQFYPEIRI